MDEREPVPSADSLRETTIQVNIMEEPKPRIDNAFLGQRPPPSIGLITRQTEPRVLETPLDKVDSFLTPTGLFYVRSHSPAPKLDAKSYRLRIGGAVRNPFSLTYEELRQMPAVTRTALLECAGNSRVFLVPQTRGAQWELGAVGTAEWTGVSLVDLLKQAGLEDDACEIVLEGPDRVLPAEEPKPPAPLAYARSLPRAKALQKDVLIAYQMNGQDLTEDHGYPVRAIVPGHYAMASVKWLTRISAVTEPFAGYWQTSDYAYWDYVDGKPVRRPLGEIGLKSEIFRPSPHETVPPNQVYSVFGAAWAGEAEVTEISISTDGGQTWSQAEFIDPIVRYAWRRWRFHWVTPKEPGRYTLFSRAKAANGDVQPEKHDENNGGYVINHSLPIEITIDDLGA
jgi:DMSO/TMAO reductase YedYZ molybdopterin-dependent catalytic subunit